MNIMANAAELKRKGRERKRKEGYVLKQFWVKPKRWKKIKEIIDNENSYEIIAEKKL